MPHSRVGTGRMRLTRAGLQPVQATGACRAVVYSRFCPFQCCPAHSVHICREMQGWGEQDVSPWPLKQSAMELAAMEVTPCRGKNHHQQQGLPSPG